MKQNQLKNIIDLDNLIQAYIRFRDWMDYDAERSAYSAKEVTIMQQLFQTAYVVVPPALIDATYENLLAVMEHRNALLTSLNEEINNSSNTGAYDDLRLGIEKSTFRTTVHYFTTISEAIWQASASMAFGDEAVSENYSIDVEPFDDHFDEVNEAKFEDIRAFIISEHPGIEHVEFPLEKVYSLGLPKQGPDPIDHGTGGK